MDKTNVGMPSPAELRQLRLARLGEGPKKVDSATQTVEADFEEMEKKSTTPETTTININIDVTKLDEVETLKSLLVFPGTEHDLKATPLDTGYQLMRDFNTELPDYSKELGLFPQPTSSIVTRIKDADESGLDDYKDLPDISGLYNNMRRSSTAVRESSKQVTPWRNVATTLSQGTKNSTRYSGSAKNDLFPDTVTKNSTRYSGSAKNDLFPDTSDDEDDVVPEDLKEYFRRATSSSATAAAGAPPRERRDHEGFALARPGKRGRQR